MSTVPTIDLGGITIPQLGIGTWQVPDDRAAEVVRTGLDIGYRHIDTAAIYGNEVGVGTGIRESGLDRSEIFVTTKLWNDRHLDATAAIDESLAKLGLDFVDLYLIHWPVPSQGHQLAAWESLIKIRESGKARAIGVSNFRIDDLKLVVERTGVVPAANQIELHPSFQQTELRALHAELGIATEAWSPLGQGKDLSLDAVTTIAAEHGVTPAQVVVRWHLQIGTIVFPKSLTASRLAENFDVLGFTLTSADMAALAACDLGNRIGTDPASL